MRPALYSAVSALALLTFALPAAAADDDHAGPGMTWSAGDVDLTLTLDAGLGFFSVANARHGLGSTARNGARAGGRDWAEGFIAPALGVDWHVLDSTVYGGFKLIGSATRGAGDAQETSSTSDRPEALVVDTAVLGWKSGLTFAALGEDAIDISAGRQPFVVGDGFLLADGTAEGFRRGAYVMGPRGAFDRTAILRVNTDPVRGDVFHLRSMTDQTYMRGNDAAATGLYGANVEWFASSHKDHGRFEYDERLWYVGATLLRAYEADRGSAQRRDGMDTYALRTGGTPLAGLGEAWAGLGLYGEYAIQRNDKAGSRQRANAWYIEPQYTFAALPWTPKIAWRYAHFSGDADTNDATGKAWDSLFTGGGPRGLSSWDQGEIYARYVGGNSNLNTHMLHATVQPDEAVTLGLVYYSHRFDQPDTANGVTSDKLQTEVNAYVLWETPLPGLNVTALAGAARAGTGRQQALGTTDANNRTTWLGQLLFGYSF